MFFVDGGALFEGEGDIHRKLLGEEANSRQNYINLMVGSKQPTPVWLSPEEADLVSSEEVVSVLGADWE